MVCTVDFNEADGNFHEGLPKKGVKLWAFQPNGLPDFSRPSSNWVANNEDELSAFWFSDAGNTDIRAIQVMTYHGQLTTIYKGTDA